MYDVDVLVFEADIIFYIVYNELAKNIAWYPGRAV